MVGRGKDELPGEEEPLDMEELMDILDGDMRMKEKVFDTFLALLPSTLGEMREMVALGKAGRLSAAAHNFKGILLYLAAGRAARLALELETTAKRGEIHEATLSALEQECERVRAFITGQRAGG